MTNGHCLDPLGLSMLAPGEVRINRAASRRITLNGKSSSLIVKTQRLLYATMTMTDMAIYELAVSYERLHTKYGIVPFVMATFGPQPGTPIDIPSAYRKKTYHCSVEEVLAGLREGGRKFEGSLRYDPHCGTINGTSGSPLVLADGRTVVGINNTVNNNGQLCTNNNPCEVNAEGATSAIRKRGYGQQTALIYECLNDEFDFDLTVEACRLPR
jgi:hypothetical protein